MVYSYYFVCPLNGVCEICGRRPCLAACKVEMGAPKILFLVYHETKTDLFGVPFLRGYVEVDAKANFGEVAKQVRAFLHRRYFSTFGEPFVSKYDGGREEALAFCAHDACRGGLHGLYEAS